MAEKCFGNKVLKFAGKGTCRIEDHPDCKITLTKFGLISVKVLPNT